MTNNSPSPTQRSSDLDALYQDAEVAQAELKKRLFNVAVDTGGSASVDIPEGLKDRQKAQTNIDKRCQGDASQLTDISRGSIVVDTLDEMKKAHQALVASGGVLSFEDRVSNPQSGSGYRDLQYCVEASNGHVSEVQIHLRALWEAKQDKGHEIYSEISGMYDTDKAEGRDLTGPEKSARNKLFKQSKKLYKGALAEAGIDLNDWDAPLPLFTGAEANAAAEAAPAALTLVANNGGAEGWRATKAANAAKAELAAGQDAVVDLDDGPTVKQEGRKMGL